MAEDSRQRRVNGDESEETSGESNVWSIAGVLLSVVPWQCMEAYQFFCSNSVFLIRTSVYLCHGNA